MTSDELLAKFYEIRSRRNVLRRARLDLLCDNEKGTVVLDEDGTPGEPCWKAARKWTEPTPYSDGGQLYQLYYDPPMSEWCANCRMRQSVSEEYRQACRAHGGALRGLMRRGKTLAARARQMREGA